MLNVGLTGNVAAGKSTVVRWFEEWGATVIDADELVRDVQQPGSPVLAAITRRFGANLVRADGSLDRSALRMKVMGDDDALAALNAIVHPAVRRERAQHAAAADTRGDCVVVNDIPLLFEVLDPGAFDLVVLVDASVEVRRARLTSLRGLSVPDADRIMAAQLPSPAKRERSDIIIDNDGSLEALREAAWEAWRTVRARAARKAAGRDGPMLALFAHPGDESLLAGGTLARYADAGVHIHLVCAGRNEETVRAAAAALAIGDVTVFNLDAAAVRADDEQAIMVVGDLLRQVRPSVILSYGPEGLDGDAARVAANTWVRRAKAVAENAALVYEVACPAAVPVTQPTLAVGASDPIAARLDVRPWRDRKRRAVAVYERGLTLAPDPAVWVDSERECYRSTFPVSGIITDLFEARRHAVDSPLEGG
jgi:dephospho-CoA kinase